MSLVTGCARSPVFVTAVERKPIDRSLVDYPGNVVLEEVISNLNSPVDCEQDAEGNLIVAESGGSQPRILGYRPDGTTFTIYPPSKLIGLPFDVIKTGFRLYAPIGGIAVENGKVYVAHRDSEGFGVITAFTYDGAHTTIISNLPCQGDYAMSDVALGRGRLWFGVGSPTNSGVVGLDNWSWVKSNPTVCDKSFVDLKLNGNHFKSKNPDAGVLGGPEIAVTAGYQPFNFSTLTRIRRVDFPSSAIYSVNPNGGGGRVEAHGIHCPRGLTFSALDTLYMTNGGMELRGTRPIKDDPDSLLKVASGWYGYPDFSTDLEPITDARFQPPPEMAIKSGYDETSFLLNHTASNNGEGLIPPPKASLLQVTFPSLSGAGRFDFVPAEGPLKEFRGDAIVPLGGDTAPFATSGKKLREPVGYKIVRVDMAGREVSDFVRNAKDLPASLLPPGQGLLERPWTVKFSPDGLSMYIVDFGQMEVVNGRMKTKIGSGRVLRLKPLDVRVVPHSEATPRQMTQPTTQAR